MNHFIPFFVFVFLNYNYLFIIVLGVEKGDFLFKELGHHFEPSSPGLRELMSMLSFVNWHVTRLQKYCRTEKGGKEEPRRKMNQERMM